MANETGILLRTGSGENIEVTADIDVEEPEALGLGQRKLKKPTCFGGTRHGRLPKCP